jgi:hypothetical protein
MIEERRLATLTLRAKVYFIWLIFKTFADILKNYKIRENQNISNGKRGMKNNTGKLL